MLKNNKNNGVKEILNERKTNKVKYKVVAFTVPIFILIVGICIYGYFNNSNNSSPIFEFDEEEVMRVNNQKVVMNEFLLYAADVYQGYNLQNEANWGSEITDSANNTITLEEQVKGTICEQIRMTKVLCMIALDERISLSSDEKDILIENAQTYYTNLTASNVIDEALTVEIITKFYEENALAQKIYNNIIEEYDKNKDLVEMEDYDAEGTELSERELYFIEKYHNLADKYDKNYNYYTSINWDLLKLLSFSELSKNPTSE
jgi:hypothetical protein